MLRRRAAGAKQAFLRLFRYGRRVLAFRRRWRARMVGAEGADAWEWLDNAVAMAAKAAPSAPDRLTITFMASIADAKTSELDRLLRSFQNQRRGIAELIFCATGRETADIKAWLARVDSLEGVRLVKGDNTLAASLDAGLAAARSPWIAHISASGVLTPFAVEHVAQALDTFAVGICLYTDEVLTDQELRPRRAIMKPAWDPVLLAGYYYLGRLAIYRRDRLLQRGGWRQAFDQAPDYDLALRCLRGVQPNQVRHLPFPAYMDRDRSRTGEAIAAERSALADAWPGIEIRPTDSGDKHRLLIDKRRHDWPRVSVIIPSRDAPALIRRVLEGVLSRTDYPDLEIIVVDNGSTDPDTLALYQSLANDPRLRVEIEPSDFNFARAVNRGVTLASGDCLLLLNNDIEIDDANWLKEMVSCLVFEKVGIVGAKLLYPDRTLQHVGVIAGLGGYAGHWCIGKPENFPGPMGRLTVRQCMSVVTGACMLISRACWEAVGTFDEEVFPIAYNDVDYCLRAVGSGWRVVWTPFATLIHHESASRGSDETPENIARFTRDKSALRARYRTDTFEDPAYHPWWSRDHSVPRPRKLKSLPKPR